MSQDLFLVLLSIACNSFICWSVWAMARAHSRARKRRAAVESLKPILDRAHAAHAAGDLESLKIQTARFEELNEAILRDYPELKEE